MNKDKIIKILSLTDIAVLAIFLILMTLVIIHASIIHQFDTTLISVITNKNMTEITFFRQYTRLANTNVITMLSIILTLILLIFKKYWLALFSSLSITSATLCNYIIKSFVKRPRPSVHHLIYAGGYSFPSGHSAGSMSMAMVLIVIIYLLVKIKPIKWTLITILVLYTTTIGISRIYLHVHYPSDVFGGFLEGFFFVLFWSLILHKKLDHY